MWTRRAVALMITRCPGSRRLCGLHARHVGSLIAVRSAIARHLLLHRKEEPHSQGQKKEEEEAPTQHKTAKFRGLTCEPRGFIRVIIISSSIISIVHIIIVHIIAIVIVNPTTTPITFLR